ncbi:hypothetical protein ACFXKD_27780 [Nocardiopsis aegyptia]|uniref:VG15 protein n=1 Tax=Nocardiopsis aegyptia TaxID=220378 RepID=UPI00367255D0
MTPEEYQRRRATASLGLLGALRPLARLLRPRPSRAEWDAWVQAAYPAVYQSRLEHWQLAQAFYREERQRATGLAGPVDFPRRNYPPEALNAGLTQMVRPRLDALEEDDPVPTVLVEEVLEVADRHAAAGGREAMVDAARHDPEALGYARIAVGAETCAFCLMLVSRGPVYKSESAALLRDGTGEPYHDRCDCIAVPVFDRASWPGRDEYLEMEAAWAEHGGDLNTWRRYIEGREEPADAGQQPASA